MPSLVVLYAKFMAVPNYTYLKLKMPGPKGVITIGSSFEHAYECDVECVERAEAQAEDEALAATLDKMASEALDSTHRPRVSRRCPSTRATPTTRRCRSAPPSTTNRKWCKDRWTKRGGELGLFQFLKQSKATLTYAMLVGHQFTN